ncbi:MAG: CpsD/CapB family tyrosine-protein kinase [Gammaproteobacteria bacterium]|nr:CpsD/CapB family tyrosine-protein kinase [Gammaproteobacteria bacterium]
MERIKQALERARQERESAAETQIRPSGSRAPGRSGQTGSSAVRADKIIYTETHVVEPDAATLERNRVIGGASAEPAEDAYRMLRTRVIQRMRDNGWNSLMVVSAGPDAGKSLTAVNLAISLAREVTHTVLLVDLDLRRPSIHTFFGVEPAHGIVDYFRKGVPLPDILFNPSIERLVVLPGKERELNSSEMLSSPQMLDLIAELTARYPERIVIFDLPPVMATDDAIAFAPNVDGALVVVENGVTKREDLSTTFDLLGGTKIIGTVINKSDDPTQAYAY